MAKWCAKWKIKSNPEKTKVIIFSRSSLARNSEPVLKLYGKKLKIYPEDKFLGVTFDSKFTFKNTLRKSWGGETPGITESDFLVNKKWGHSPSTILQIYKQCLRQIFEYSSLSTIATSVTIISKIQWFQNKFIQLVLRLPKYVSVKLLHDSSGLPYVKGRLLSCATRTLERIYKNNLAEESITFNRVNPAWDRFRKPLSAVRPDSLYITTTYRSNFSKHPIAPKTGSQTNTRTLGTVFRLRINNPTQTILLVCLS